MKEAFCKWHNRLIREVEEYQQEQCDEYKMSCETCGYLGKKEIVNEID